MMKVAEAMSKADDVMMVDAEVMDKVAEVMMKVAEAMSKADDVMVVVAEVMGKGAEAIVLVAEAIMVQFLLKLWWCF